jgi:hypothetical protein
MEIENTQIVTSEEKPIDQKTKIGLIIGGIILLALFIGAVIFLLNSEKTPIIRDIFVILLGFELFIIGFAAILLIIQTARLINMFQHEVKPVLDAANETMSTFRGTALFISDSLVQPVIKLNGYFASIKQAADLVKNLFK